MIMVTMDPVCYVLVNSNQTPYPVWKYYIENLLKSRLTSSGSGIISAKCLIKGNENPGPSTRTNFFTSSTGSSSHRCKKRFKLSLVFMLRRGVWSREKVKNVSKTPMSRTGYCVTGKSAYIYIYMWYQSRTS